MIYDLPMMYPWYIDISTYRWSIDDLIFFSMNGHPRPCWDSVKPQSKSTVLDVSQHRFTRLNGRLWLPKGQIWRSCPKRQFFETCFWFLYQSGVCRGPSRGFQKPFHNWKTSNKNNWFSNIFCKALDEICLICNLSETSHFEIVANKAPRVWQRFCDFRLRRKSEIARQKNPTRGPWVFLSGNSRSRDFWRLLNDFRRLFWLFSPLLV